MKHKSHTVSDEWKTKASSTIAFKPIRYRRKKVGEIRRHAPDKMIFWSKRTPDQVHYKLDAWGIDAETLELLRMMQVRYIGIEVSNGDTYIGRIADFVNPDKGATRVEYAGRGGATVMWFLPKVHFAAKIKERGGLELLSLPKRA